MAAEDAGLSALKGAKNIIVRDKINLAICIYHKLSDVYDIISHIMDIWLYGLIVILRQGITRHIDGKLFYMLGRMVL